MAAFIRKLIRNLLIIAIALVVICACLLTRVPNPQTGLTPDGTPANPDWAAGAVLVYEPDSTIGSFVADFDPNESPDYYKIIGEATTVTEDMPTGVIYYGQPDDEGRTNSAYGWITGEMRAERLAQGAPKPASVEDPDIWPYQYQIDATIPGAQGRATCSGWFWNHSRLVAWSLGGDSFKHNMIAGTLTQVVGDNQTPGGMTYPVSVACNWLDTHPDGRLWYYSCPIYLTGELIPRAVIVDIYTEDGALNEKVLVYNTAAGFDIDYVTGEAAPVS